MGYKKDTSKADHEARVEAISAHLKAATESQDRRLGEMAMRLMVHLDERRATPFGRFTPSVVVSGLPRYAKKTFGAFTVEFDNGYTDGIEFKVWKDYDSENPDMIASFPVAVSFDVDASRDALNLAEYRAKLLACRLASDENERVP